MHYYKRNLGDYAKKAGRLTILQHGAYNLLIDACYDRESFPTIEEATDWAWASTVEEIEAVKFVLAKFFSVDADGKYIQKRIQEEIEEFHLFCERQAVKGKKGGRPKKPSGLNKKPSGFSEKADGKPEESHCKAGKSLTTNHKPLTTNQEPITSKQITTLSSKHDPVSDIFNYWVLKMDKSARATKLTPKRKKAIQSRLRDGYTADHIKSAIVNCSNDPWSMGQNDRHTPFNDIELICRTGEKLESFIAHNPSQCSVEQLANKTQKMLNEMDEENSWMR